MSKTNKIVIIIAVILIIILGMIAMNNKSRDNSSNNNISNKSQTETTNQIATKKSNRTFEIYNTNIKTNTGSTKLTATIKNISGSKTERQKLEIVLVDKNSNEIGTLMTTIPSLNVDDTTEIIAEDLKVYENIYDFKIK